MARRRDITATSARSQKWLWEAIYRNGETLFINRSGETATHVTSESGLVVEPPISDAISYGRVLLPSDVSLPEYDDPGSVFEEVDRYLARWAIMPPEFRYVTAAFVVLTWIYDTFPASPYLQFVGETGTGKSHNLKAVGMIAYHPIFLSGADTEAVMFRSVDQHYPATVVLDEADFRQSGPAAAITKMLTMGYERDAAISRCSSDRDDFAPRTFRIGGPKIIASRAPHEDRAILARSFRLQTSGLPDREFPGPEEDMPREASELVNKLLWFRLTQKVEALDKLPEKPQRANGHTMRAAKALISVARHVGSAEAEQAILDHVGRTATEVLSERALSPEAAVLTAISSRFRLDRQISVGDIANEIQKDGADCDLWSNGNVSPRKVGAILTSLGIQRARTGRNGSWAVQLTEDELRRLEAEWGLG